VPVLQPVDMVLPGAEFLDEPSRRRLLGRYGADAAALVVAAQPGELDPIPPTNFLWAELRWAARAEGVVHLEDLLLRRVRLGLLLPRGGRDLLRRVREICQPELGWDDARWEAEAAAYLDLWDCSYSPPEAAAVPDWRATLERARQECRLEPSPLRRRLGHWPWLAGLVGLVLLLLALLRRWCKRLVENG
jgi:glycerol-3-phosphate dehydrogenase